MAQEISVNTQMVAVIADGTISDAERDNLDGSWTLTTVRPMQRKIRQAFRNSLFTIVEWHIHTGTQALDEPE